MFFFHTALRSKDFIVGLRNASIFNTIRPTLWNYTVCGQYPGTVDAAETVSVDCQENLPPFTYVIIQFPFKDHIMNFFEVEVYARADVTATTSVTERGHVGISVSTPYTGNATLLV